MTQRPSIAPTLWLFCALTLLSGCKSVPDPLRLEGESMGTTWQVTAYAGDLPASDIQTRIEARLQDVVQQMSAWEPDSVLSQFNRASAGTWVDFPPDLFMLVEHALELAEISAGAYDPTVAPLVNLWGFGVEPAPLTEPPSEEAVIATKVRVGWQKLRLDRMRLRAYQSGGIELDINSLGPGFAVDALADVLQTAGVERFLIELGGEMRAGDAKPDGSAWRVGIESPQAQTSAGFDTVVTLKGKALGTSGDYRVGFLHGGRRYSHTIDPRTGAPVNHDLAAVTVIGDSAMAADAHAAALLVLGPSDGMSFAREHKLAALFTLRTPDGFVRQATPAFESYRSQ